MKVYIYNLMFAKLAAVNKACSDINAQVVNISNDELHSSIESIIASKPKKALKDCDSNISELMVFDGFSEDALDAFLSSYKSTKAPIVQFKALTTPINLKWSPAYLYEHLKEEIGEK